MLEKILRWIVLCGVFATPFIVLVIDPSMYFSYDTGRNFAFRIIIEIIVGSWLVLSLVYEKYRPRRSLIIGAFALFVIVMAIADAQGVDPYRSFWDGYGRMEGWVTLIHIFAYLVVASSVIASEKIWRLLFRVSLGVSVFVGIYGLFQLAGVLPLALGGQPSISARIDSTLGNPTYLAVYMLFHIFIALLLWHQTWVAQPPKKRLAPSLIYGAITLLDTIVLLFTGSRGPVLGLIGGATLTLIILAFVQRSHRLRMVAATTVTLILVLGSCLILARDSAFVRSVGFVDRLANISLGDATIQSRLRYVDIAWQGVKERPVFGWGQENYYFVYQKYYDPHADGSEQWNDRVHNIIFNWLIAGGFLGLIAYFSIFGATLWILWMRNVLLNPERAILTGLLAAYTINNLAFFDTITSYILFATILAYIVFREREARKNASLFAKTMFPHNALPFLAAIGVIVVIGTAWWTNAAAYAASRALGEAFLPQGALTKNLEDLKQAIAYGSYGTDEARAQLATLTLNVVAVESVPVEIQRQFFDAANHELQLWSEESPLDDQPLLLRGVLLQTVGDYVDADVLLQRAHELSPRRQNILFALASNALARGDLAQELAYYKEAYDLDPSYALAAQSYRAALQAAEQATPFMKAESDMLIQEIDHGTAR
jgi:O-antigen ligase